jgi:hypothetical protein
MPVAVLSVLLADNGGSDAAADADALADDIAVASRSYRCTRS